EGDRAELVAYVVGAGAAPSPAELRAPAAGSQVGVPIPDLRVYVLDAFGRPAPVGVPGEMYVGGAGPARGYLGRAALTAEKFVPDPFSALPGARLYRSGDSARWTVDGRLEYLGRIDQQVKIRGFRIEPGEIEAALLAHPSVAEAAVVVRGEGDRAELVAYLVSAAGAVDAEALRSHLRGSLPDYMVPGAFVALDRLPLTTNGKLDVRALPAPEHAAAEERYVAPRNPTEEVLAGIWAEVLRVQRVGVHDDFFELGGHSLLATRVVARVREVFAVELPLRALFEGPTVEALAREVETLRRAGHAQLPPIVPVARGRALPLSFGQERLWILESLGQGGAAYNMADALRLRGATRVAALEHALGEIVRRHESLRTTFAEVDGAPVQVIAPFDGFTLEIADLSGLGDAEREAEARRLSQEEAERPFDLAAGPLFRARLLRLGDEDHLLLISLHHVISDGWSLGVFYRELWTLYEAALAGRESPLPELAVQYADYAVWQREHLRGE
ncbi:MAG TPA: condensation domain-containing protein, partial [Longimicrobiaceae bacterium]